MLFVVCMCWREVVQIKIAAKCDDKRIGNTNHARGVSGHRCPIITSPRLMERIAITSLVYGDEIGIM